MQGAEKRKKVLMIAYQFPPMGGSGVQRTTKFVKYLRLFGWEPVVFTRDIKGMDLVDHSLMQDVPSDVKVCRTKAYDPTSLKGPLMYLGKFLGRKVFIPDSERLWQIMSLSAAKRVIKDESPDIIYSTSYPYSDHLLALHLKKQFPHIPWVADFRDEWTNNPYLLDNPHSHFRMNIEKRMEKDVLLNADYLITNTPVMLDNFIKNNQEIENIDKKFCYIPNGYDEEDFKGINFKKKPSQKFTMTYAGLLYGRRKPDTLFEAIYSLISEGKIKNKNIIVRLIGNYKMNYINGLIDKFNLRDIVEVMPYMPHNECILKLAESDVLLHIEGSGPGGEAFYSGKIFEYMNMKRPVIAIIPPSGAAAQLIKQVKIGSVSDFNSVEDIKNNILYYYNQWLQGEIQYEPDYELIAKYERKHLTGQLANIFDDLLKKHGGRFL